MKRIQMPKRFEIQMGLMNWSMQWGLIVLWGAVRFPGYSCTMWEHHIQITFDCEAWHYLGRNLRKLLPRIYCA